MDTKEAQDLILRAAENPASLTPEELATNLPLALSTVLVRNELLGAKPVAVTLNMIATGPVARKPGFGPAPKLKTVGYELEVRPCDGVWSKFEGRIIAVLSYEGSESEHRQHLLPDHGPANNGRTFVTSRPYWLRSRSRERLERRLKGMLDKHTTELRRQQAERIPLHPTMGGWA